MNDLQNVGREINDEEFIVIGEFEVIENLHKFAKEVLKRDESDPVRCRYPDYVMELCKHISSRESIRITRVYPSLVKLGYGIKYHDYKNGDTTISDLIELIDRVRASDIGEYRALDTIASNVISFDGKSKPFRYDNNFIAETAEYADKMNVHASDLYMYYCLVGLSEVCEMDRYKHLDNDIGRIKALYGLKKADASFKFVVMFIGEFIMEH